MGELPLTSWEINDEDEFFAQQKKDKCILQDVVMEEARARRQEREKRSIERDERAKNLREECERALGPEEQAFTWYRWKKAGRDGEIRENQEEDVDEEQNRVNQRPQMNSLWALAHSHYGIFASSRLGDSEEEEEVPRPTNDGILQPPRRREMTSDTKSKERKATMKDIIENIYRKPRNGTPAVPKTRVVARNMPGGMKVLKNDSNTMKADGRTVETGS